MQRDFPASRLKLMTSTPCAAVVSLCCAAKLLIHSCLEQLLRYDGGGGVLIDKSVNGDNFN